MGLNDEHEDDCSVIGDKGEIGFIDYADDVSVCSYNPVEEGPVIVSVPFPFVKGKNPQSVLVGETAYDPITIRNTTSEPVELWGVSIYASNPEGSFTVSLMEPPRSAGPDSVSDFLESFSLDDRVLQPGETLTVWLSCKPRDVGLHTSAVHFDIGNDSVERLVLLLADDKVSKNLGSRAPYVRGQRKKKQFSVETFVTGPRPARAHPIVVRKNRLPRYLIPKETRELLESKEIPGVVREGLGDERSYVDFFKALLIMEELQLEQDMSCYDMENICFGRRGHFLSLEVPGLAERRPSLVHGDTIFAKLASECWDETSPPFEGSIHRVEADEVHLRFAPEFHIRHRDGNLYNIRFTYNRVNMRRQYQAIDASLELDRGFLFPSDAYYQRRVIKRNPLVPISSNTLNEEQTRSIEMILGCKGAPPYVIHGPPGTGKTVTLVETILQLYKTQKRAQILVCAPSNSAADHILEKILQSKAVKLKQNEIFRLNASARPYEEMNPDFAPFCYFEDDIFKCPPVDDLMHYRIIVSTYMSVSVMHAEGVRRGHFTHIFLDEAGQASEPETMISVANFCKRGTVVVLAGDPLQLGPVILSKEADLHGLGKSYLERIFDFEPYNDMDENYITKLVRNYRCHPEILHLPSQLFYKGELVACKVDSSPFMERVDFLPSRDFPVLFFGIQGSDEREGSNPSWFNRFEASKVVDVVKKLTQNRDLHDGDIGVITPYRQQVLKLKTALEHLDRTNVKVGSVEQFQGQERQVIIVSTVRSTIRHNDFDKTHCLGFLSNPRRFNVAMTRAISLLIIIGNPHIICKDAYWNMLLWRCIDNNSYQGCPPLERQDFVEEDPPEEFGSNGYGQRDYGSSKEVDRVEEPAWKTESSGPTGNWADESEAAGGGWANDPLPSDFPEPSGWD